MKQRRPPRLASGGGWDYILTAMKHIDLTRLFDPQKLILVGASDQKLFSAGIARYLFAHGFAERTTLVNAKGNTVFGRAAHAAIAGAASEGPFDLAIVVVPAQHVERAVEELAAIGVKLAIVESAGFAETGPEGVVRQTSLKTKAASLGVRLLGPNCVGVVDTRSRFSSTEVQQESLKQGGVALIAQSGVFGSILLDWAPFNGLHLSKSITLGNRIDLDEADFLNWLADDPDTRVVALYLEGVCDGPKFMDAVRRCAAKKPVVVLKGGVTGAGAKAVGSHTASLAGSDAVFAGALAQAGGIRAQSLEHLTDIAAAFDRCPVPRGPNVAMVTTSGSQGILATDTIVAGGLRLAELASETIAKVKTLAPPWMTVGNPLDVGPSGLYNVALDALLDDPHVDALLLLIAIPWGAFAPILADGHTLEILFNDLDKLRAKAKQMPILVAHFGHPQFVKLTKETVGDFLPVYPNAERAAAALTAMATFRKAE